MTAQELETAFICGYNKKPETIYFAIGSVSLVGECYNCNLSDTYRAYLLISKNDDNCIKFWSLNEPEAICIGLNELTNPLKNTWVQYPLSVFSQFIKLGIDINKGYDILVWGNISKGIQLSPEDVLMSFTAFTLDKQFGTSIAPIIISERNTCRGHKFSVVNSDCLNQLAVCKTTRLENENISVSHAENIRVKVVISNTYYSHGLDLSTCRNIEKECKLAIEGLNTFFTSNEIAEITENDAKSIESYIKDPTIAKRAKHIIGEVNRLKKAINALKNGDWDLIGQLMNETHISLKDNMEVVSSDIDEMVTETWNMSGVLGSRMTCCLVGCSTISLVYEDFVDSFVENAGRAFYLKTDIKPEFYIADIGDFALKFLNL